MVVRVGRFYSFPFSNYVLLVGSTPDPYVRTPDPKIHDQRQKDVKLYNT